MSCSWKGASLFGALIGLHLVCYLDENFVLLIALEVGCGNVICIMIVSGLMGQRKPMLGWYQIMMLWTWQTRLTKFKTITNFLNSNRMCLFGVFYIWITMLVLNLDWRDEAINVIAYRFFINMFLLSCILARCLSWTIALFFSSILLWWGACSHFLVNSNAICVWGA